MATSDAQAVRRAVAANGSQAAAARAAAEAESGLAKVIGESVALHLAQLLPQLLGGLAVQPACVLCVADRKKAEAALAPVLQGGDQEAAAKAMAALPAVQQSVTSLPLGAPGQPASVLPVCYGHFHLPPEVRAVGLVDAGGQPIMGSGAGVNCAVCGRPLELGEILVCDDKAACSARFDPDRPAEGMLYALGGRHLQAVLDPE